MSHNSSNKDIYYVPATSTRPILASLSMFVLGVGAALFLQGSSAAPIILLLGFFSLITVVYLWFGDVVRESLSGMNNAQMDVSYRLGMAWFIFSEIFFFGGFFGAFFYAKYLVLPDLVDALSATHIYLYPDYSSSWPILENPDPNKYIGADHAMHAWGLPAINTAILLTSGVTLTIAHWGLNKNNFRQLISGLVATVALGVLFILLQAYEYYHAIYDLNLTLQSGIYGSTFYLLTGFHGLHVILGTIMLIVVTIRSYKGHFSHEHHFAFEATAWYWHFVDVVWLFLFFLVYLF